MLLEKDSAIKLGKIDGVEEPELLTKHQVNNQANMVKK